MQRSLGRIIPIDAGIYVNDKQYIMFDYVRHNQATYICKKDCIGQEPTEENTEFWKIIAKDGTDGKDGENGASLTAISTPVEGGIKVTILNAETEEVVDEFELKNGVDGNILNKWKGDYSDSTYYFPGDMVHYIGGVYVSKYPYGMKGNEPTDDRFWDVFCKDGETPTIFALYAKSDTPTDPETLDYSETYPEVEPGKFIWVRILFVNSTRVTKVYMCSMIGENGGGSGDMSKSVYDTNNDGIVDKAEALSNGTDIVTCDDVKDHIDSLVMSENGVHGLRYDGTSLYAKDSDDVEHEIKTGGGTGGGSNENLLINSWFEVNQRNGYYAPIGTTYYSSSSFNVELGELTTNIQCESLGMYGKITVNGVAGYVKPSDCIKGYCNPYDMTVDSWKNDGATGVVKITEDGIISSALLRQYIEWDKWKFLKGRKATMSILYTDGTLCVATPYLMPTEPPTEYKRGTSVVTPYGNDVYVAECSDGKIMVTIAGTNTIAIRAIKIEAGEISTLDRDIAPNHALEIAKCKASTADTTDTYANKGNIAMISEFEFSNENLVENAWFNINQRGLTEYSGTSNMYTVDRWKNYQDTAILEKTNEGIKLTSSINDGMAYLYTVFDEELKQKLTGKTVTISALARNSGTQPHILGIRAGKNNFGINDEYLTDEWTLITGTGIFETSGSTYNRGIILFSIGYAPFSPNEGVEIKAVKLELGTVSTLKNDIAPSITTELLKCQRYFKRITSTENGTIVGTGVYATSNYTDFMIPISTPFRTKPTVEIKNPSGLKIKYGGSLYDISTSQAPTVIGMTDDSITIRLYHSSNISSSYSQFLIVNDTNAEILLSADL